MRGVEGLGAALTFALTLSGATAQAQTPASQPTSCAAQETGVPAGRLASLARGFNLTGWLDRKPGTAPDKAALRELRAHGFTHVRLPVKAEHYLPEVAGPGPAATAFGELERAADELLRLGFAVSLDMHPGEELSDVRKREPRRFERLLGGLWTRLAAAFVSRSAERVFFEILNEPENAAEYAMTVRMARTVRGAAPNHTLILGPPSFQRIEALEATVPLPDRNVVYAVHFYDPMAFTHQGLDWAAPDDPLREFKGVPFPSGPDHPAVTALRARLVSEGKLAAAAALKTQLADRWDEGSVGRAFARAQAWSQHHRVPVIVNEFGVLAWHAPRADRARWIEAVRRAAERHCIGWTHWDYADGFGFMRREGGREVPDPAILDALVGPGR